MRFVVAIALLATLCPRATGAPEAPTAGFSRKLAAETVPATLPRTCQTNEIFSLVKFSGEVREEEDPANQ